MDGEDFSVSEYVDLIQRNSKAIECIAQAYSQMRALGVESFLLTAIPDAVTKLAKQIDLQAEAEMAVRKE